MLSLWPDAVAQGAKDPGTMAIKYGRESVGTISTGRRSDGLWNRGGGVIF